jgi:hypothetical protein
MRFVMRAYGPEPRTSTARNVTQVVLRATTAEDALVEADGHWRRHPSLRRCRGYSVFDATGKPLGYVTASEVA